MRHAIPLVCVFLAAAVAMAQPPPLPPGLGDEPAATTAPPLPPGLGGEPAATTTTTGTDRQFNLPPGLRSFWDNRLGTRLQSDPAQDDDLVLAESRLQLDYDRHFTHLELKLTGDFLFDAMADDRGIDLNRGEGWFDLRQANISFTPMPAVDVRIGRQILTWGTGDMLFINDNFPKDWVSYFIGRDVEYLKAPSDAIKASFFSDYANLDLVYTPQFDADRYITGERLSYYNAGLGRRAGDDAPVRPLTPDSWFSDDEVAARLYRMLGSYEVAAYSYHGYWKSPAGQTPDGQPTFPALAVYGASVRGSFLAGIGNLEIGYYDSRDDRSGSNPLVRNSEWRFLAGYERDLSFIAPDFTIAVQYYVELMQNYGAYCDSLPVGSPPRDEDRHLITLRLTRMLMQQNLELSWFTYWSPTDADLFLRPAISYKVSDNWRVFGGANIFIGEDDHSFFGQFEKNSNLYGGFRYSF